MSTLQQFEFLEFAIEITAIHAEAYRQLRHVAIGLTELTLQEAPLEIAHRHRQSVRTVRDLAFGFMFIRAIAYALYDLLG
jgi:hypothetical protein